MEYEFLLVGYKIVTNNLNLDINKEESNLDKIIKEIFKETNYFRKKIFQIDNCKIKIKYCIDKEILKNLKDKDFIKGQDEVIKIFENINNPDCYLCIEKLNMLDELGL